MEKQEYKSETFRRWHAEALAEGEQKGLLEGERKGLLEGELKGRQEGLQIALLKILEKRGLVLAEEDTARILASSDATQLQTWIDRAFDVNSVSDLWKS